MNWLQWIGTRLFQTASLLLFLLLFCGILVFVGSKIRSWIFLNTSLSEEVCDVLSVSIIILFVGLIGSVMFFVGGFL